MTLVQPDFELFFAFRIGKGPLTQFTDDDVGINLVIVRQMLQIFPTLKAGKP
jgi:hypothetical protein